MTSSLPVHSPHRKPQMESAFVARALGRKEAARLAQLMDDAEKKARARIAVALREVDDIFSRARAEAQAIIDVLPDAGAARAVSDKAGAAIRNAANAHRMPVMAVIGRGQTKVERAARHDAIRGIMAACPALSDAEIAHYFTGMEAGTVKRLRQA